MKLNEIYEVEVIDDNHNGTGISKINDVSIFIKGAITGDIINIKIIKINKKYAIGQIENYIKKQKREKISCPYYNECGGCNLLHISYERENELKKKYIQKLFKNYSVDITYFKRFNYRNKITLHVKNNKLGLFQFESNNLIPITKCELVSNKINNLIKELSSFNLTNVTEITIRTGIEGLLIYTKGKLVNEDKIKLINNKDVVSIYQNDSLIYGQKNITEKVGDFKYICNHRSFLQVNNDCTKALYDKVKLNIMNNSTLLDLYCGSGTIGIYCSDICKNITGIEINKDSVKCCKENLKINNISNYKIIQGDASLIKDIYDIVVVDPPRSGLSKNVIKNLNNNLYKKIIYISCNPSTLKRDIGLLKNYKLKEINVFNMFPGTKHIETLSILILN